MTASQRLRRGSDELMSEHEQVKRFADELDALVERYRKEFDLCYASAVGALTMKAHLLMVEAENQEE